MSKRRVAGPGRRVSTGHLRVDTARAVKKLREYQLAEPASWVLEVLRAAITLGATRLAVEGDTSDVSVLWDGGLLDDETMRTVLDELVNPGTSRHDGAIRRLAIGLNTALGLRPRRVDIERVDADGQRTRVRYTSEMLEGPESAELTGDASAALARLTAERVTPAADEAPPGMRVTMRKRIGLDSLRRFLGRAEPDELRLVRELADDVPVPLHIGDTVLRRDESPNDLLRIPLSAGLDGFVALVDADSTIAGNQPAWVDFAERGVILARAPLPLGSAWNGPQVSVPIRLFLDRHSLPTNASRSAVRVNDALRTALDLAAKRVPQLLEDAHRLLRGEEPALAQPPGGAREDAASLHARVRKSVLHLVAAYVVGKRWRFDSGTMPAELQPLMALPLLRNAVGAPASVLDFAESAGVVYRGQAPLPAEFYGDSLRNLLFLPPGDAGHVLVPEATHDAERVTSLLERAAAQVSAKAAFMKLATALPVIALTDRNAWVVVPIRATRHESFVAHEPLPLPDVEGEVALAPSTGRPIGRITLLHAARPVEELLVPALVSYAAVVTSPRVRPLPNYRGVVDDAGRREVVAAVERAVVVAGEVAAAVMLGRAADVSDARVRPGTPPETRPSKEHWLTLQAAHAEALRRTSDRPYCEASPLAQVRAIAVLYPDGERRLESAIEVIAHARTTGALLYRDPQGKRAPGAFPLALLDGEHAAGLAAVAGVPAARIDASPRSAPSVPRVDAHAVLQVRGEGFAAEIGWGDVEGSCTLYRDGSMLEQRSFSPHLLPAAVHVDDVRVVVDAATGTVVLRPSHHGMLLSWETALLAALIAAADHKPPAELRVRYPTDIARQLCRAMALAPKPFRKHFDRDYRRLSDTLELPTARGGTISLSALRGQAVAWWLPQGARIPFDHPEFRPVAIDSPWCAWVSAILGRELRDGTDMVSEYARQAAGAEKRERLLAQPPVPAPVLDARDPVQRGVEQREVRGVLKVPSEPPFTLSLTVSGRPVGEVGLPIALPFSGQLDVHPSLMDPAWDSLSERGRSVLTKLLRDELEAALVAMAQEHPLQLHTARGMLLVDTWGQQRTGPKAGARVREALSHARAWPSVQGPTVSLLEAKRRGRIHAAAFQGPWLEPQKGERKAQLDQAVIAAYAPIAASSLARFAAIVDVGPLTDTTHAVQQLQSRRRVERGTSELPRLGHPEAVSLAKLLKDDPTLLAGLGLGEARLTLGAEGANPSTAYLHISGARVASQALAVFPPVELAFEATGYFGADEPSRLEKRKLTLLTKRVQRLANRLVTRAFESGEASVALKLATRNAWLGMRTMEVAAVADFPLLETTADEWTSVAALRAAEATRGPAWFTTDLASRVVPDDAGRVALRLTTGEAQALGKELALEDATEWLAVQAIRTANKRRPKATSLDAREWLAARSMPAGTTPLAYAELTPEGHESATGSLVVLTPAAWSALGMVVHRELHPLGAFACPSHWPALVVVNDPSLTPNARYDEPVKDARWEALLRQVAGATRSALRRRFDPGDDFGARRVEVTLPSGTMGVGLIGLGDPLTAGELLVTGERTERLREFPVRGELFVCAEPTQALLANVNVSVMIAIARTAYHELLLDFADALEGVPVLNTEFTPSLARNPDDWSAEERDLAEAHVVLGALRGTLPKTHAVHEKLLVRCFRPHPLPLRAAQALVRGNRAVAVVDPGEHESGSNEPSLVLDDSLVSLVIRAELGARARRVPHPSEQLSAGRSQDDPSATSVASASTSRASHALDALVEELTELLAATSALGVHGPIRVVLSPRRGGPMLTIDVVRGQVLLAAENPSLRLVAAALRADDPSRGRRAAIALAAHALALLDDTAEPSRRPHHVRAFEEWLAPG